MPTLNQKTVRTYDKIAKHFSGAHFNPTFWQKEFRIFQKLIKGNRVIDIGCGAGRDAVLFESSNFNYTGIDASVGMLEEARKRVVRGKFFVMDFYNLKFASQTFDGFWAAASLLHVPKHRVRKVLRNISNLLKADGVGFISIKERRHIGQGIVHENKYGGIERFFAFYTDKEFQKVIKDSGFALIKNHVLVGDDANWLCYFVCKSNDQ